MVFERKKAGQANEDADSDTPEVKAPGPILQLYLPQLPVWPDWAIYWTLGNFSKPLATISFPKSDTFLGNFYKGVKIFIFLVKSFFGQLL